MSFFTSLIDPFTKATIIIILFDIALGYSKAWALNRYTSKNARRGIVEHFSIIIFVILARYLIIDFSNYSPILLGFEIFLTLSYLVSVLKNLIRVGVPVPEYLIKKLESELKNKNTEE